MTQEQKDADDFDARMGDGAASSTPVIGHNNPPDTNYDYTQFVDEAEQVKPEDSLLRLTKLAGQQLDAEAAVAAAEAALLRAKDTLKDISERQIPELMQEVGMASYKTTTGLSIDVEENYRVSPPKAKRLECWAWLRANGAVALLKRKITVEFGKGEDEKAEALSTQLTKDYSLVQDDTNVHPQTLAAYVKKQMRDGKPIPTDLFGIYVQKSSTITRPE